MQNACNLINQSINQLSKLAWSKLSKLAWYSIATVLLAAPVTLCDDFRKTQGYGFSVVEVDRAQYTVGVLNLPVQTHEESTVLRWDS